MVNDNKTCVMCNKAYKYCEGCPSKYNITETWRNIFCSENCRDWYKIYDQIKAGQIIEKEAIRKLKKIDCSYVRDLNEPMKSVFLVLLNTSNSKKENENKEVDNEIENKSVVNDTVEINKKSLKMRPKSKSKLMK